MMVRQIRQQWFHREDLMGWLPPVLVGLGLRFWHIGFGLPNLFRPDEDMVVLPALGMIGGNLDPHDYTYPTLYKYLLALIFRVLMAFGIGVPEAQTAWQYAAYGFFVDASVFILTARVTTALFGVVTIAAVYRIGCEGYNRFVGTAAAWVLAVSVLHVRDSHFGVTDVPAVAFLMLGLLFCMRVVIQGALKDYMWAGVLIGLGASTKYGSVLGLVPLGVAHVMCKTNGKSWVYWLGRRHVWLSAGACVLIFVVTSPYVVWNLDGFVRDFGFQMRHVYQYGHGDDLGMGWFYHPTVTLRYGLGAMAVLLAVVGLVIVCLRRRRADWVLLSLFVAFYAITGQGRTVFFRYALPLLPLCAMFVGIALHALREWPVVPRRFAGFVGVGLLGLILVEPLWASVQLDRLLGRSDTRLQARQWIEKQLPEGAFIANVGGLYGDVPLRNRRAVGWWLARFYWAFDAVPGSGLVAFLSRFESSMPPIYLYHHHTGMKDLGEHSQGRIDLFDNKDIAVVITHEHPLSYSHVTPDFMAELGRRAVLWQVFLPGDLNELQQAVFDRQDAFYYPVGGFGNLACGGPVVKIWRVKDRDGLILEHAGNSRLIIRDTFLGLGNSRMAQRLYNEALEYYQRALEIDPDFADVHVMMGATYIHQDRFEEASQKIRQALTLGLDMGQLERAVFLERTLDGHLYAKLGIACAMAGYYAEAAVVYERAVLMGAESMDVYNNLGVIYNALQRYSDAVRSFQKALLLDPHNEDAQHNLNRVKQKMAQ